MSTFGTNLQLSALDGADGFQINREAAGDLAGRSVSDAGDVNGDGFDDIIVGAPWADPNGFSSGAAYVVFGKAGGFAANLELSTLNGASGFQIRGEERGDSAGYYVSAAGDVNGDGADDIIVGALFASPNGFSSGAAYVVFGKAGGFAATLNLSTLNGATGFQISGELAGDRAGYSVSSAGDVNGDGFDDLIVGAPGANPNGSDSGAAYVVFGKAGGFAANLNLSTLDGATGFQISGEAPGDEAGFSVSSGGDVNGDGFDDLIVGANGADPNGVDSGAAYVVFGKAGGFAANLNLSTLNGTDGFQISGEAVGYDAGQSVSSAGDVNGDGFGDLIVGAFGANGYSGAAYVVFGKAGGFAATLDLSTLNGTTGFQISGEAVEDFAGFSVSAAGDVNGDGFDDIIVGASGADPNSLASGAAYVVFGKAGGFAANLNLSTLNGTDGFQISGEGYEDYAGYSVSSAGDVNGDGFSDLIVGASGAKPNGNQSGVAYIIYGKQTAPTSMADTLTGASGNETITGLGGDDLLSGMTGNDSLAGNDGDDRLDGGGGEDLLDGGSGADWLTGGKGDDAYVTDGADMIIENAGEGVDTVWSSASVTLSANVEHLILIGAVAVSGTGNGGDNILTGNGGANTLDGKGGSDTLDGGQGADRLIGGTGDDTYIFGAGDVIVETAGEGKDTVVVAVSFTLAENVENLTLTGSVDIDGTGNTGDNTLTGNEADNVLDGMGGSDTLDGMGGSDTLDGGSGADRLSGGTGDDTYVTNGGDTIIEKRGEGTDTVRASASTTLSANVENLVLTGTSSVKGSGNGLDNFVTGNAGNNRLEGAAGADTLDGGKGADSLIGGSGRDFLVGEAGDDRLDGGAGNDILLGWTGRDVMTGGAGRDLFVFATRPVAGQADTITDFNVGKDVLMLYGTQFTGLGSAESFLRAEAFEENTSGNAGDSSDRIIYERDTGKLFFDRDGTGSAAKVHFATLDKNLALTHGDFFVF